MRGLSARQMARRSVYMRLIRAEVDGEWYPVCEADMSHLRVMARARHLVVNGYHCRLNEAGKRWYANQVRFLLYQKRVKDLAQAAFLLPYVDPIPFDPSAAELRALMLLREAKAAHRHTIPQARIDAREIGRLVDAGLVVVHASSYEISTDGSLLLFQLGEIRHPESA